MEQQAETQQADQQKRLQGLINDNNVLLFMKGTPDFPMCGFSMKAAQALAAVGKTDYAFVNVLEDQDARSVLPSVSNWPTFPQLFVGGELLGGSDIVLEMFESGELKQAIDGAA